MDPNENPLHSLSRLWDYAVRPGEIALLRAFQFDILDKYGDPSGHDLYQLKLGLIAMRRLAAVSTGVMTGLHLAQTAPECTSSWLPITLLISGVILTANMIIDTQINKYIQS